MKGLDYSLRDLAPVLAEVSLSVLKGTYRPGEVRAVRIPKSNGKFRTLSVADVVDRVVAQALYRAIGPYFDHQFLPMSYGFRPGISHLDLLADLHHSIAAGNTVLAIDDIATAFDVVRHDLLLEDLDRLAPAEVNYRSLLTTMIRGGQNHDSIGIPQGSAISPMLLNISLNNRFDTVISSDAFPFLGRYADNIIGAAGTELEARKIYDRSEELLKNAGYTFKGNRDTGIIDLRRKDATVELRVQEGQDDKPIAPDLLGFRIRLDQGQPRFTVTSRAWNKMDESLKSAHDFENPLEQARRYLDGWIAAIGPALPKRARYFEEKILKKLRYWKHQFPDAEIFLQKRIKRAEQRWKHLLWTHKDARHSSLRQVSGRGEWRGGR